MKMQIIYQCDTKARTTFVKASNESKPCARECNNLRIRSTRVNFINILLANFLYKSELSSFSLITFGFAIFWRQNISEKVAHKMLMKLTPGLLELSMGFPL